MITDVLRYEMVSGAGRVSAGTHCFVGDGLSSDWRECGRAVSCDWEAVNGGVVGRFISL